jgi:peptide methionine sulfoxide reductase MsrA
MGAVVSIVALVVGLAIGCCCGGKAGHQRPDKIGRLFLGLCSACAFVAGLIGVLWFFLQPPPFSVEIDGPPAYSSNDPTASVYVGQGCFWHTQYDFVVLEQEAGGAFGGRSDEQVTSLVGYGGGRFESASGTVCYHGFPSSDYNKLGHAEAVSLTVDISNATRAAVQIEQIARLYFEHGYKTVNGKRQRLDPQDMGAEYRNVIGLPGGMDNKAWWPIFEAANVYNMKTARGKGSTDGDTEGEYVVYVYDSDQFPFFRGEAYHQFHTNDVLGRRVPASYTRDLKDTQHRLGRLDDMGCAQVPYEVSLLLLAVSGAVMSFGFGWLWVTLPFLKSIQANWLSGESTTVRTIGRTTTE